MAYDELLAKKVKKTLDKGGVSFVERKMFGGIAFMLNGNMCCGIIKDELVLRVGPEIAKEMLSLENIRVMDFTGRPMRGFVVVEQDLVQNKPELWELLEPAVSFATSLPPK